MAEHDQANPPERVEGRPSKMALRLIEAFRAAATDAVDVNLRRGHAVVGMVDGVWTEKKLER